MGGTYDLDRGRRLSVLDTLTVNSVTLTGVITGPGSATITGTTNLWAFSGSIQLGTDVGSGVASTVTLTGATVSAGTHNMTMTNGPSTSSQTTATWVKVYVGTTALCVPAFPIL